MPTGHRIFKAYPGIEYNIRAAVLGGSYPFTHALSNAPSGMTINADTGEISWPNPASSASDIVLTVTDAENTVATATWSITVTTTGFKFVDASAGSGGTGAIDSPWDALADVHASSAVSDIIYFRAGTYTPDGITRGSVGSDWERIEFGGSRSAQWLAYPGETVYYDAGYSAGVDVGAMVRLTGSATYPVYVDGIKFHNTRNILLQLVSEGGRWQTVRRCELYDIRDGIDGGNPAGIMTMTDNSNTNPTYYGVFQDIDAHDLVDAGAVKMYGQFKVLMENITNVDCSTGPDIAKDNMTRWEVRGCTVTGSTLDNTQSGLYGSMNDPAYTGYPFNGEIRYNLVITGADADTFACHLNEFGVADQIDVYRNTFVGGLVGVVQVNTEEDGPFNFYNNVIQNAESGDHVTKWTTQYGTPVSTASNVVIGTDNGTGCLDNLTGTSGLVNADGTLAVAYLSYRGTHGFEVP
jgi:hypothetical protein